MGFPGNSEWAVDAVCILYLHRFELAPFTTIHTHRRRFQDTAQIECRVIHSVSRILWADRLLQGDHGFAKLLLYPPFSQAASSPIVHEAVYEAIPPIVRGRAQPKDDRALAGTRCTFIGLPTNAFDAVIIFTRRKTRPRPAARARSIYIRNTRRFAPRAEFRRPLRSLTIKNR